jgi:hypothetical protein
MRICFFESQEGAHSFQPCPEREQVIKKAASARREREATLNAGF